MKLFSWLKPKKKDDLEVINSLMIKYIERAKTSAYHMYFSNGEYTIATREYIEVKTIKDKKEALEYYLSLEEDNK